MLRSLGVPSQTWPKLHYGTSATASGSGSSDALAVAALILAAVAVVLGVLAVWLDRPRFGEPDR